MAIRKSAAAEKIVAQRLSYFDQKIGRMIEGEVVMVDAAMAKEMLNENPDNRRVSVRTVETYARAMSNGDWDLVFDPIRFNKDDELIDGQHRLMAVIKSDTVQPFLVVRGLSTESRKVLDQPRGRTSRDNLHMMGVEGYGDKATIATLLIRWDMDAITGSHVKIQNQEVVNFVVANNDLLIRAVNTAKAARNAIRLAKGAAGAVFFRAHRIDVFAANEFFEKLASGEGLETGSPILAARNVIIRTKATTTNRGRRVTTPEEMYYLVRAWNAYRRGEYLSKLQLPVNGQLSSANFMMV